ncbi:MAG: hypothetical protein H7312_22865 [Tardiphaga sp.]|nr:hypothetical protein [Tardiphaga sp.]
MTKLVLEIIWGLVAVGSLVGGLFAAASNPQIDGDAAITWFLIAAGVVSILYCLPG